jgi:ArsR family transcriptional regulator
MKDTVETIETVETRRPCCSVTATPITERDAEVRARRFKALADPTRVQIVSMLVRNEGPVCVCDITSWFPLGQPTVSYHLKVLRDAGLVDCDRRGPWCYYFVRPEAAAWVRFALEGV